MGEEGGTGKSRVINAIQGFCQSWQRKGSLVVTALTGKAASTISRQTFASLEMSLKSASRHTIVQYVDCIIIDEVSMMSKDQLLRLDRLLRKSKRVSDVPFGGLFIILSGESRTLTLKVQQFPFVCAVGATVYKVQGESLRSMAVVDWKSGGKGANKHQQVYIMVSRVVTREGPICLKPFTSDLASWPNHLPQRSKKTSDSTRRSSVH